MFGSSVIDADRHAWEQAPRISHWVYESIPGQINGCDGEGRVLMAIAASPMFGLRLAAAFDARSATQIQANGGAFGARPRPPTLSL